MGNTTDDHTTDDGLYIQTNSSHHDKPYPDDGVPIDPTHPATDDGVEETEEMQAGLGAASGVEDPRWPAEVPPTTDEAEQVA